jgi:VCBS repeat-containing protein
MKARAANRKLRPRTRSLVLERLETRVVLDGGIRAFVSAGTLRIQGDAQDNQIVVEQLSPRSFAVSSRDGATLINGKSGAATFFGVRKDINIALGAGHDALKIKGNGTIVTGRLLVNLGAGNDALEISDLSIKAAKRSSIQGGGGTDFANREGVQRQIKFAGFEQIADSVSDSAAGEPLIGIQSLAVGDTAVVVENAIPNTALGNVLANDTGGAANQIVAVSGFAANVGSPVPGQFGTFQIFANGTFTYILNNDNPSVNALNDGQTLTDTIGYTVSDGIAPSTATLTITIQGVTDTSPLTATIDTAVVIEDAIPNTALGNVLLNDTGGVATKVVTAVRGFAANVGTPVPGQFGYFQIFFNGTYTYILNNDNATVNALNSGQTLIDSIPYTVTSGSETSTGTLAITIQGNSDTGPLVGVNDAAVVTEDTIPNVALGNVLTNDLGGIRIKRVTAVKGFAANVGAPVAGQFGVFQIQQDGTFTYIANNDNPSVNALGDGQTLSDSIVYTLSDGSASSTATLVITIQGKAG